MPDIGIIERSATELALAVYDWAKETGGLIDGPSGQPSDVDLLEFLGLPADAVAALATKKLRRLKLVTVTADDDQQHIGILLKNQLPDATRKNLPGKLGNITVEYIGHSDVPGFPPTVEPQSSASGGSRFWTPGGRFACGSSVTAAPIPSAGTLGALVRLADGHLYGLTNNHVTGGCNHTEVGMYVLCPSAIDAVVGRPPPTAIGAHHSLTVIQSGDPGQLRKQRLDAAIFRIPDESVVTSWQGDMEYDTPTATTRPVAHMRVRKVGRTTGLTHGRINGEVKTPLVIPYKAQRLQAEVHFEGLWTVVGSHGDEFSTCGDSGSLVVTEDGKYAVGLVLGGQQGATYIMPIADVLAHFDAILVGAHNT